MTERRGAISVILPTYQRADLLPETLRSLLSQSRAPVEIVVVDDGSTDATERAVRRAGPGLRYIRQENAGKSAALNRGLAAVSGDYVWIFDDDDIALPDAAETLAGALDRGADGFAFGRYRRFRDGPDGVRREAGPGYWPARPEPAWDALLDDFHMFQPACMVRRAAFEAVGPFREDLLRAQDYEMALRLARRFRGTFVERDLFLQREHDGARGAGRERFGAAERFPKWIAYGRTIFRELRRDLPLGAWTPPGARSARAALVRRGAAMARRGLWDLAGDDFAAAGARAAEGPPAPAELRAIRAAFLGKYGCAEVATRPGLAGMLGDALGGAAAREPWSGRARRALAEPLVWRAREALTAGRPREAAGHLRALARIAGRDGAASLALGRLRGRSAALLAGPGAAGARREVGS